MGTTRHDNGSDTGKRDISTLQARGHFYLALTEEWTGLRPFFVKPFCKITKTRKDTGF
jgi:hypothetical protein